MVKAGDRVVLRGGKAQDAMLVMHRSSANMPVVIHEPRGAYSASSAIAVRPVKRTATEPLYARWPPNMSAARPPATLPATAAMPDTSKKALTPAAAVLVSRIASGVM